MGCGGSKEAAASNRHASRSKYLAGPGGEDGFQGIPLYNAPAGPLTAKDYKERLVTSEGTQSVYLPRAGYTIRYAYVSQRGYYPDSPDKANQDAFCVHTSFNGDAEQHFFGVFDGHGDCGTQCSQFARDKVPLNLLSSPHFITNPALAFHQAMVATNLQCHRSEFDDSMSGTTAVTVLMRGRSLLVANVGDSRAVMGERVPGQPQNFIARDLSIDQTPYRKDECDRVRAAGARVLTLDQVEGLKDPTTECWTTEEEDDGDPPRLWFPNGMYPGTAFTRSIGDAAAERIGVFAEPELEFRHLGPHDAFLIIASDGVFEFISSQRVVDMVSKFDDPHEACLSVVAESYRLWLQYETRTDDITMIMLQLGGLELPPPPPPGSLPAPSLGVGQQQQQQQLAAPAGTLNGTSAAAAAAAAAAATQEHAAAAAAAAAQEQQQQQRQQSLLDGLSHAHAPGQHHHLASMMRGHLVDDIEALSLSSSTQQQEGAGSGDGGGALAAVSRWLHPGQQLAAGGGASAGRSGSGGLSAALVAAAQHARAADEPLQLGNISPQQFRMLEDSVRTNFLFSHLSEAERLLVYKAMVRMEVQAGDVVIRQGDRGDFFYIVEAGQFSVLVATTDGAALEQQQGQQQQGVSPPHSPGGRGGSPQQQQQQQQQGGSRLQQLGSPTHGGAGRPRTSSNILLDNDMMADLAASAADESLMSAFGPADGEEGATHQTPSASQGGGVGLLGGVQTEWGELVHTYVAAPLGAGGGGDAGAAHPSFGELALLYGKPRAATVVAQTAGVLWKLSRDDFRAALQSGRGDAGALVLRTLRSCEVLECLTMGQLILLAGLLKPAIYRDGDIIGRQGDMSEEFFIVAQGDVVASVRRTGSTSNLAADQQQQQQQAGSSAAAAAGGGGAREVLTMGPGAFFGEKSLQAPHPRPATMTARGSVLLLSVSRPNFEATFGPLGALMAEHAAWQAWIKSQPDLLGRSAVLGPKYSDMLQGKFDPQSLQMRGVLWMLNDALVLASLADPASDVTLTARLLSVEVVMERALSQALMRARGITSSLPPCLFVPHVVRAWHSPASGPAVLAGEALATAGVCTLGALLQEGPLDERSAAYVAAMALLGLSHLHHLGVVYRGLSAITLLVTEAGLVQLVDFRFACRPEGRTFTLCGVPEYLAPEVVGGTGHDESVDWWALGVLIFHLLTGGTPFAQLGDDELRIYRRILRGAFSWPDTAAGHDLSPDARDLVRQLLKTDPAQRLGTARGGVTRLKSHPWFRWLNWSDLQEGRTMVPLGLRERLFHAAGSWSDVACWAPGHRPPGAANPAWLDEF